MAPDADPCEGVELGDSGEVFRLKVYHAPLVHRARRDVAGVDEVPQPRGRVGVVLVVQNTHGLILRTIPGHPRTVVSGVIRRAAAMTTARPRSPP